MKRKWPLFLFLTLPVLVVLYSNCGKETVQFKVYGTSTVTGNSMTAAQTLLFATCSVINRCFQATISQCQAGVLSTTGIASQLGLSNTVYGPFSSIVQAEQAGTLLPNTPATNNCYTSINDLACSDPTVQNSYNPTSQTPYSGVAQMIPANSCGGVYQPTGWTALSNTQLQNVCPAATSNYNFPVLCTNVISSWSGAALDTKRNRLLVWGGGANNYAGNEIYALDVMSKTMSRLNSPSPITDCVETLSDGSPNSRATYGGLTYIPSSDALFSYGGVPACSTKSGPIGGTWLLNLSTLQWQKMNPSGTPPGAFNINGAGVGVVSDYDPGTNLVFLDDGFQFFSYDPKANSYAVLNGAAGIDYHMTGVVDPGRKLFIIAGGDVVNGGGLKVIDISPGSAYAVQNWTNQVTGCAGFLSSASPGLAYDSALKTIIAWNGGGSVYSFNPDTKTCTTTSFANGPTAAQVNGTFGRFRYVPGLNIFVLVNDAAQNAFTLGL